MRFAKLTSSLQLAYFYRFSHRLTYQNGEADISILSEQVAVKPSSTYRYHWPFVCMFPVTDQCLWSGFCHSTEQPINVVTSKWCWREEIMYSMYRCTPSVGHAYIPLTTVLISLPLSQSHTHIHSQTTLTIVMVKLSVSQF